MYSNGPTVPKKWPCLSLKNGPNVNVVIFLYQKGVLLWKVFGVFWKCLYTFLYMYTHFVMSSRLVCIPMALLSLKMALPVPQKWPQCQCGNFFISKRVLLWKVFEVFWKCLYTFLYMYTHFVMSSRFVCIPMA